MRTPKTASTERTWLHHPHSPPFWRRSSAPSGAPPPSPEHHDYFTFPRMHRTPSTFTERVADAIDDARDTVESGCMRLLWRGVTWWAWHRWRR